MNGATLFRVAEALVEPATRCSFSARALAVPVLAALLAAGGMFVFPDAALAQEVVPVITVEADETPVAEGKSALFTIRRGGPAEDSLDVVVEVTTTGLFALSRTETLTIRPDNTAFSYGFLMAGDDRADPDRAVTVELMTPEDGSYDVGSPSSATVVVEDDDELAVQVTTAVVDANGVAVSEVPEDIGTATIRLTATSNGSVAPPTGFGVSVSTDGDSANSPDDYGVLSVTTAFAVADFVLDDTDNVYSAAKDVLLTIVDDTDDEDRETLTLKTERAPGHPEWLSFSDSRVEVTIVDNDAIPGQPADLEATADGVAAIDLSWNAPDEAANPPITGYLIEWSPDGSSDWAELVDDTGSDATTYEDSGLTAGTTRHYRVSAINLVGTGPASGPASATTDPELTIQVTTAVVDGNGVVVTEVPEHIGQVTVRVTATTDGSVAPTERVDIMVGSGAGTANRPADYRLVGEEFDLEEADWVLVAADQSYRAIVDVVLSIVDDSLEEERETVQLVTEHAASSPYGIQLPAVVVVAIIDNDGEPVYALSVDPASIAEAGGVATVKVSTGGVTLATDQEFALTLGGTATVDTDYTIDSTTLTLAAGQTEVAATITAVDDTEDDDAETVVVTASLDGTTVGSAQTITIDDDDDGLPEVEFSGWTPEVIEGEVATFTLVRSGPTTDPLTVLVEVSETGSMISGQPPTSVVFPAGADFKTLNISTVDDDVDEPDSVVTATITSGEDAPYALGTEVSLESIVTDNDDLEVYVTTAVVDAEGLAVTEVPESIGAATIRVTASTGGSLPPTSDFGVSVSTRADSAVSPDDFAALSLLVGYQVSDWVLVDAEGTYRAVKDVSLAIVDDSLEEPEPETLGLVAERVPGTPAYVNFPPRLELAIVDNDSAPPNPVLPEVTIAARSTPVDEGTDVMFFLSRTGGAAEALTVSVEVVETGSMISGTAPTTAIFAVGAEETTFTVSTADDFVDESDSRITATVAAKEDALYTIGTGSSTVVTVLDNDSVPGEPTDLVATAAGQAAIDLTWAEPGDTGTSAIAGYRIERSADGTSGWTDLVGDTGSSATEYRDNSLEPGATHYYRVFAMNFAGTGPPSNVASATTASDPPEPEPPGPPEVTIEPATSPVDEGTEVMFFLSRTGGTAEALTVSVEVVETGSMISGTAPTTAIFAVGAEETTFTVSTADDFVDESDSRITATVAAKEDALYTIGMGSSTVVTVLDNDAVPGGPTDLVATAAGPTAIDLRWTIPSDGGSSAITGYRIEWSADGSSGWTELVADTGSDTTTYTDVDLTAGTTRYYRVFALNLVGAGPASNVASATTASDPPEPEPPGPPAVTIEPATSPVDEGTEVMFFLSRTGGTAEALTVSVEVVETGSMISGTAPTTAIFAVGAQESTFTVPTADDFVDESDSRITATVTASEDALYTIGTGSSAVVTVLDNDAVPGGPTDLVATAAGPTAIDLRWTIPSEGGSSTITGYRIEWSADGSSGWNELVADTGSDTTTYTDVDLTAGTTRYYRVFALNLVGAGPASNVASATTASDPPEPELPEVTIAAGTSPVDEGTQVTFLLSRTGPAAEVLTVSVEVEETGSMIGGMAPTTAVFAVGAEETTLTVPTADDFVDEPASVISATVTAGEVASYSVGTASLAAVTVNDNDAVPGAPDGLEATADGEAAIHLRWVPPSDSGSSAITGYQVEWSTDGSSGWKELGDSSSTETAYRDNGLDPGTTRYYRVCAMNSTGPGPVSNVAGATTSLLLPEVTITAAESAVDEGAAVTFVLSRTGVAAELLAVSLEATETGSTIGGAPPASAVFPAGAAETTLSIVTEDNSLDEPDRAITVTLREGDGYKLGGEASATVQVKDNDAAPVLAIADVSAPEGVGEIVFTVTLSGESAMPATVRWASSAQTAEPGLDYVEASGELTFAPGTTSQPLAVAVLEDLLVEEAETFRVSLSEATNAAFEAGSATAATGTIEDDDDVAPAEEWLARFGRTAASNAVDAVEDRLTGRLGAGDQVVVAGHRVDVAGSGPDQGAAGSGQGYAGSAAAPVTGLGGIGRAAGGLGGEPGFGGGLWDAQPGRYGSGRMDAGDVLARSSFQLSSGSHASGYSNRGPANGAAHGDDAGVQRWSVWGSGAATRFDGGEGDLSLDGEVVSGTVGADIERGRVLFGVAVSHSRGDGDYRRDAVGGLRQREGELSSDLTTGLPYLRVAVSDRLSVWGALGRGSGSMALSEGDLGSIDADIAMTLGAFGARQELRSAASTDGLSLALRTDLLLVHTTSDETEALPALSADVNRLRLMLEGARRLQFDSGVVLTPQVEIGLRYDDGDAETGGGVEVGAGLRLEDAAQGLSVELKGRSLLTHEASEIAEWGVGGSLRFEPGGGDRGLAIGLRSTLGAASSGIARLWEQQNAAPTAYRAAAPGSVTEAEIGYGLAVLGSRGSLTPYLSAGLSERYGETYKAGARLKVGESFALEAEAARVERNDATPSLFRAALLASMRW